ncbi:hypothetical protein ES708_25866 [subsurface metagenome]
MPLDNDVDVKLLASQSEGFVGSDVEALCREAGMAALRQNFNIAKVSMKHFKKAIKKIHPTVTPEVLKYYEQISEKFKRTSQLSTPQIGFT